MEDRSVLLTGGNSKFGHTLSKMFKGAGWDTEIIPRDAHYEENLYTPQKENYDLIFINHAKIIDMPGWKFDPMPEHLLNSCKTRAMGWMISNDSERLGGKPFMDDPIFTLYIAQKAVYIQQCRYYQKKCNTFVYNPGHLTEDLWKSTAMDIINKTEGLFVSNATAEVYHAQLDPAAW